MRAFLISLVFFFNGILLVDIAGALWTNMMPGKLEKYLPFLTEEKREELFGSISSVVTSPRGDPVREGVIRGTAFASVLKGDGESNSFFFGPDKIH